MSHEKLLSLAASSRCDGVHIHANAEGLRELKAAIGRLLEALEKRNECDHEHFFTEDWGGQELSASMLDSEKKEGFSQVQELKIFAWTDEWKLRHGLRGLAVED